jgi:hypothetical protein
LPTQQKAKPLKRYWKKAAMNPVNDENEYLEIKNRQEETPDVTSIFRVQAKPY